MTTWLLSLMDAENVQRSRVHLTVRGQNLDNDSSDDDEDRDEDLAMT